MTDISVMAIVSAALGGSDNAEAALVILPLAFLFVGWVLWLLHSDRKSRERRAANEAARVRRMQNFIGVQLERDKRS